MAILDAALQEFYEKGLAGARLDDIAVKANVSKGTLYLYFSSKEDLFRDLIAHHTAPVMERLDQAINLAPNLGQALENFATFAPIIVEQGNMPSMMKIMIGESQVFPEIIREHRERIIDKSIALFSNMLEQAQQRGEIAIDDTELTARLFFAPVVYSGIWQAVFAKTAPKPLDYAALIRTHTELLLKGLHYRPADKAPPA